MDPMTLGLLLNTGGLIASQIGGNRPKYEIPDSAKQALGQARLLAYDQSAPGESRKMDAARLSSANAVRAAQEGGNALEAVAGIQGQENRAVQGILADSEMAQRKDMDDYMNLLLQMGGKEDMAFQMNEFAPYADKQNEMRDILGAATENLAYKSLMDDTRYNLLSDEEKSALELREKQEKEQKKKEKLERVLGRKAGKLGMGLDDLSSMFGANDMTGASNNLGLLLKSLF